ncbi:MAG: ABC transporter substrate-binding protein [Pigmentiphaga sp.]|nr:ABC transporter substrate-binding protein [Pigmentiphaga sp.]
MANISRLTHGAAALALGLSALAHLPAQAQEPTPELRIGAVISITGGASSLGVNAANAIKILEERYAANTSLPYNVKIVTYDDATDPSKALNAVRRLIQEDKVHAVICCSTTPNSMAIIPTVQEAKVPTISLALASSIVEPVEERQFVFKTAVTDYLTVDRVMDDMIQKGMKRIAFLGLEDSYGEGGWIEFQKVAKERGLEIVAAERFSRNDTNFTAQALRVRQSNPDAVYFHAIPPSASLAQAALQRAGFRGQSYQSGGSANQGFINVGKAAVEGTIVAVGPIQVYDQFEEGHPMAPALNEFAEVFDGRYGAGKADIFAGYGWDAIRMIATAYDGLRQDGQVPADLAEARLAMRDAIESLQDYYAVSGVFSFSPEDHLGLDHRSIYLTTVKDGEFVLNTD